MSVIRKIPFFNYPALFKQQEKEIMDTFHDVLTRGAYILQKDVEDFEENIKQLINVRHVISVADGTNALILALRAAGIGSGDEVIVCSHTYIATAASAHFVGATPILVECGWDHMMDPDSAEKAVTSRTRALMPTHVNGRSCNMDALQSIAEKYGLIIIEDAAQALTSRFKGKCAGTFGLAGTFSFYPAKVLGCFGDGGAVVTYDDDIAKKLFLLRDHGRNKEGKVVAWGTNCRLDNIQAAVLNMKLKTFKKDIDRRREIAALYDNGLKDIRYLTLPPSPHSDNDHYDIYQNYEIQAESRDELRDYLGLRGIGTIIQWGGEAVHQCRNLGFENINLPIVEKMTSRFLMLPMNTSLMDEDIKYICNCITEFYTRKV
jgi:dTDP-4-amino-4,6-dideoxygalactose transaminase